MQLSCDNSAGSVWRLRLQPAGRQDIVVTEAGLQQLLAAVADAEQGEACRVLVLEGSGGQFCRGMDLQGVADQEETASGLRLFARSLSALRDCSKVVIAAVDGAVVAGGIGLAAAADMVIATEQSSFALPEVMLGLLPGMVLATLLERMAPQKVRALALTVGSLDGAEALRIGLIDKLVTDSEQLEKTLRRVVKNLLRAQPSAVAALKEVVAEAADKPFAEALELGLQATEKRLAQPSCREAIASFVAGEPLPWFDRYRPGRGS